MRRHIVCFALFTLISPSGLDAASRSHPGIGQPDLVVTGMKFLVGRPGQEAQEAGGIIDTTCRVLVSVTVKNVGRGVADLSKVSVHWRLEEYPPGAGAAGVFGEKILKPGASTGGGVFFIEPGQVPPGVYRVAIKVDPDNGLVESRENNNLRVGSLTIQAPAGEMGAPDLSVGEVRWKGVPSAPCESLQLDVEVKNEGKGAAYVLTGMVATAKPGFTYRGPGVGMYLQPGKSKTFALDADPGWTSRPGPRVVEVGVRPDKKEINLSNNQRSVTLTVPTVPEKECDLTVTSVQFKPAFPSVSDLISFSARMENRGPGPAYFCPKDTEWEMTLSSPGGVSGGVAVHGRKVPPGETFGGGVIFAQPGTLEPGVYQARVTVNPKRQARESDYENNTWSGTLEVLGPNAVKPGSGQARPLRKLPKKMKP